MIQPSQVCGAVLAGGDSTRFEGGDKALAELDGRPLVAHAVHAVADATGPTPLIGVRSEAGHAWFRDALPGGVRPVTDVPDLSGPLAGLYAAAEVAATPWLFVCACDMPLVSHDSITSLYAVDGVEGASAVVPRVGGRDQPLHALYRRDDLLDVRSRLEAGDGLFVLLDALEGVVRPTPQEVDGLADAVTNVNTCADLQELRGVRVEPVRQ